MDVNATIKTAVLQKIKYKSEFVLCRICIKPRYMTYFHGQNVQHKSFHWLNNSDWAEFNCRLEKVLELNKDNFKDTRFLIHNKIKLYFQKSTIPTNVLLQCLDNNDVNCENDIAFALECNIEYCGGEEYVTNNIVKSSEIDETLEYIPGIPKECIEYTPTPLKFNNQNIDHNYAEQYLPESHVDVTDEFLKDIKLDIPTYNPSKISPIKSSKERNNNKIETNSVNKDICKYDDDDDQNNLLIENKNQTSSYEPRNKKFKEENKMSRKKIKNALKLDSEDLFGTDEESDIKINIELNESQNISTANKTNNKRDISKKGDFHKERKGMNKWLKKKDANPEVSCINESENKPKMKCSDIDEKLTNRKNNVSNISLDELDKHIQSADEFITKKFGSSLSFLEHADPEKIDILTLNDMNLKELLNTYSDFKSILNATFETSRNMVDAKGSNGLDHMFIMRLIDDRDIKFEMMNKLNCIYNDKRKVVPHQYASLFANILLPEWLLNIFMKKFLFTRKEAILQINKQEKYKVHLNSDRYDAILFKK